MCLLAGIDLCQFSNTAAGQVSFGVGLSGSPDVRTQYFTKDGNAFPSFVWNTLERILERVRNANGTQMERSTVPTGQLVFSHNFKFSNFHEFQYITVYQYIYTVS